MITTMYTCDICKQSKSKEDLANFKIAADGISIKDCNHYVPLNIDICKDCLKKKGFVVERTDDISTEEILNKNKRTLEDKLFEILEDLGVAFVE